MQLLELQTQFARRALGYEHDDKLDQLVRANGLDGGRRLNVYRNNVRTTLAEALQATYPVLCELVGEDFFASFAQRYAAQHPPKTGDVADYGDQIAQFASASPELSKLQYLPDIARLEWACHTSYRAQDAKRIAIKALQKIPATSHEHLLFEFVPSVKFVSSPFPIFDIWQFVVDPAKRNEEPPNLDSEGQSVMTLRDNSDVNVILLSEIEHKFATSLAEGNTLAATLQKIADPFEALELQDLLHKLFSLGTMARISVGNSP